MTIPHHCTSHVRRFPLNIIQQNHTGAKLKAKKAQIHTLEHLLHILHDVKWHKVQIKHLNLEYDHSSSLYFTCAQVSTDYHKAEPYWSQQ